MSAAAYQAGDDLDFGFWLVLGVGMTAMID